MPLMIISHYHYLQRVVWLEGLNVMKLALSRLPNFIIINGFLYKSNEAPFPDSNLKEYNKMFQVYIYMLPLRYT